MIGAAIVICEVGFWLVLAAGLTARYGLRRPRLGAALLLCVPLVDLELLVVTGLDLARGTTAHFTHGLAALYLGFSVAFGHGLIRGVDGWVARRMNWPDAPPKPAPLHGRARVAQAWRGYGRALLAAGIAALMLGLLILIGGTDATRSLWQDGGWFAVIGLLALAALLLGPLRTMAAVGRSPHGAGPEDRLASTGR